MSTLFTPLTFLAIFSALDFFFSESTLPLSDDDAVFHFEIEPAAFDGVVGGELAPHVVVDQIVGDRL